MKSYVARSSFIHKTGQFTARKDYIEMQLCLTNIFWAIFAPLLPVLWWPLGFSHKIFPLILSLVGEQLNKAFIASKDKPNIGQKLFI